MTHMQTQIAIYRLPWHLSEPYGRHVSLKDLDEKHLPRIFSASVYATATERPPQFHCFPYFLSLPSVLLPSFISSFLYPCIHENRHLRIYLFTSFFVGLPDYLRSCSRVPVLTYSFVSAYIDLFIYLLVHS